MAVEVYGFLVPNNVAALDKKLCTAEMVMFLPNFVDTFNMITFCWLEILLLFKNNLQVYITFM